jgi:hypothetical protein
MDTKNKVIVTQHVYALARQVYHETVQNIENADDLKFFGNEVIPALHLTAEAAERAEQEARTVYGKDFDTQVKPFINTDTYPRK